MKGEAAKVLLRRVLQCLPAYNHFKRILPPLKEKKKELIFHENLSH
jgi:hypothetical protein